MFFSMYLFIDCSIDQWLSLCHTSHPSGTATFGWHRSVFPLWISCGGRYSPANEAARTAVICRLSFEWAIGMIFYLAQCIVHLAVGTVWSQLNPRSFGMSFITISALISAKNSSWSSSKCSNETFPSFEHFLCNILWFPRKVTGLRLGRVWFPRKVTGLRPFVLESTLPKL